MVGESPPLTGSACAFWQLAPSEREALQKAVSADHLEKQGLREGTHREILNERGRTVFDIGFARAIRKALGN
ncbi:gamma-mobile-trio protein GmtX [Paraburkholderia sediminicola]